MGTTIQARSVQSDFNALLQHSHIKYRAIYCHCLFSFPDFFLIVPPPFPLVNMQSDFLQFFKMFDKPCGHALIGFENLRILVLFREPGYADELVGQDDIEMALRSASVRWATLS